MSEFSAGILEVVTNLQDIAIEATKKNLDLGSLLASVQISHPLHPSHILQLLPTITNQPFCKKEGLFVCSYCLKNGDGWGWQCCNKNCDFAMHLDCAVIKESKDPRQAWIPTTTYPKLS